jgi:hypothetical protein
MITEFVCLGNSTKVGGRCLAGVEVDSNHRVVKNGSHPKWIRPICNTLHGEIPTDLVANIKLLDIVSIDVTGRTSTGYQSENALFVTSSIARKGTLSKSSLDEMCESERMIFGNRGKAVPEVSIGSLHRSLMLLKLTAFTAIEREYDDNPGNPQVRLVFTSTNVRYDLPVTDPVFLHSYKLNPQLLDRVNSIYVTISLGVELDGWYYKLVAAIIW